MNSRYVLFLFWFNLVLCIVRLLSMRLKLTRRNRASFVDYEQRRVGSVRLGEGFLVCDFNVFV
jgi:hypothetical protein